MTTIILLLISNFFIPRNEGYKLRIFQKYNFDKTAHNSERFISSTTDNLKLNKLESNIYDIERQYLDRVNLDKIVDLLDSSTDEKQKSDLWKNLETKLSTDIELSMR